MVYFNQKKPLLAQLETARLELDQQLNRALEISASNPDIMPEDRGFPDSYLTLALYRLNTVLTRLIDLDDTRFNLFHEYKLAPRCEPTEVVPGSRLCLVLEEAVKLAAPNRVIGVGHFLKAVVSLSLDTAAASYMGSTLHNTFSVETLLWGLGHTAWTSVADAPQVKHLLESLAGRDPVQDHQYLLTLQNGRMVFRTTSVLDPYTMVGRNKPTTRLALLTHFSDSYTGFLPCEVLELEDLINHPKVKEEELQRFLEQHPRFFRMWDFRDVFPHVYLTREDDGELIPDFILVDSDLQKAMVLDLKLPEKQIIIGSKNRRRLSSPVSEARAQLLRYRDWFEDHDNREKVKEQVGIEVYRPRIGVIIGRRSAFRSELERQRVAADNPDLEIVTYDDVLEFAKRRLLLVQRASRQ